MTVVSLDLTVPSLLTLVRSVCEISWAQPASKHQSAKTAAAAQIRAGLILILFFIPDAILSPIRILTMGIAPTGEGDGEGDGHPAS